MYLVTGGAGFLGEIIVNELLQRGEKVRSFDLNAPKIIHKNLEIVTGDVRNEKLVNSLFKNIKFVHHNIAQVPLAKDKNLFWSVNYDGTKNLLYASLKNQVEHFIYTSSSAIYGVPESNPIDEKCKPNPSEEYGKAKFAGEKLCKDYEQKGLICSIIRPRTILGEGRLGIFQILFEWIYLGLNIPVLDEGKNIYQFVHAKDLANASIAAGKKSNGNTYNIGAQKYSSMKEAIQFLINNSNSRSQIKSISSKYAEIAMNITSKIGFSPLGNYHALMYGKDFYFDTSLAEKELEYTSNYSNNQMFLESYNWYCNNRDDVLNGNHYGSIHQSAMKQKILRIVPHII